MRRPAARRTRGLEARKEAGHCRRAAPRSSGRLDTACSRSRKSRHRWSGVSSRSTAATTGSCTELDPQTAQRSAATLDALQASIAPCERHMLESIAADAVLSRRADIIESAPGCCCLTAASLCAEMPELGTLSRRVMASLLDLAPTVATPNSTWAAVASMPGVLTPSSTKMLTTRLLTASMRFRSPTTLFAGARNIHPGDRKRHP